MITTRFFTIPKSNEREIAMIPAVLEAPLAQPTNTLPEMSDELHSDIALVCKMLSDGTRLRILMHLMREKELHVTALCERLGQSQPAVSHHLALLRNSGLIEARRDGKHNFYSIRKARFQSIMSQLFASISEPGSDEIHIDDFVLSHDV